MTIFLAVPSWPIDWSGDAMAYALAHVAKGVLRVDDDGTIWRCLEARRGRWVNVEPRRAENVGAVEGGV